MATLSSSLPMLGGVRRAVKQTLFSVGYYHQRLAQFEFPGAAILCYHGIRHGGERVPFSDLHVSRDSFDSHCRLIADACDPISLEDFRAARAGTRKLPPRPVLVTFDDGYRSVLEHALPSLERYRIPAVVFITTAPVFESRHFWFDALWQRDGEAAVDRAKMLPYAEWRALRDAFSTAAAFEEPHRPLTLAELQRLAANPLIEIGGHTMRHPVLALAPVEEQRREIGGCRTQLQEALGKPIESFAYPFGQLAEHYQPETTSIVRESGFDVAFTTHPSFVTDYGHPYEVPRFLMLDSVDDVELAHRLVHSWRAVGEIA